MMSVLVRLIVEGYILWGVCIKLLQLFQRQSQCQITPSACGNWNKNVNFTYLGKVVSKKWNVRMICYYFEYKRYFFQKGLLVRTLLVHPNIFARNILMIYKIVLWRDWTGCKDQTWFGKVSCIDYHYMDVRNLSFAITNLSGSSCK